MNSNRERIDEVVQNLFTAKKSKFRQLKIIASRKKTVSSKNVSKTKDTSRSTIAIEKWGKRKQKQSGIGFLQKNIFPKVEGKHLEEWEKLQVIPWGGNYTKATGETVRLYSTCAIDTFLQIIFFFYALNIDQMENLFCSEDPLVSADKYF